MGSVSSGPAVDRALSDDAIGPMKTPGTGVWRTGEDGRIEPDREGVA